MVRSTSKCGRPKRSLVNEIHKKFKKLRKKQCIVYKTCRKTSNNNAGTKSNNKKVRISTLNGINNPKTNSNPENISPRYLERTRKNSTKISKTKVKSPCLQANRYTELIIKNTQTNITKPLPLKNTGGPRNLRIFYLRICLFAVSLCRPNLKICKIYVLLPRLCAIFDRIIS